MKQFLTLRLSTPVLCCVLCFAAFAGCNRLEPYEVPSADPDVFWSDEVFYFNGIDGYVMDKLILPEFEVAEIDEFSVTYQNVTVRKMNTYCKKMEQNGFSVVRHDYVTYFYSDTCWIRISHTLDFKDGSASLSYRTRTSEIPENAITAEKAKQIIGTDCPYPLIDVTPAGVYEATGGRIFDVPPSGSGQMSAEEYKEYVSIPWDERPRSLYFATEEYAVPMGMTRLAYADVDANGVREIWTLDYGPTSGLFTFALSAYENGERKYSEIYYADHGALNFCEKNGKLRVSNDVTRYLDGERYSEHQEYKISIVDEIVYLTHNGIPLN
ncbi:MAG: hypothetical protein IIW17_03775 [Clostridia bacterium]|nr:hypothetical protein [Clostridia bacterium]